ncbi:Mlr7403 protein [hydrothermal vent metagenome]|uniref:Ancillary SecYEG translocon subunit n=1 Tax=hydrothermal vent metagenome TaxID=652676 RepID=A0A1W1DZ43_9ZZZZ
MKNFIEVGKTEDEQAEQIKKWLKENLPYIVIGITLGLGGIWSFNYYEVAQQKKAIEARGNYLSIVANPSDTKSLDALKAQDENGTYMQQAELVLAQQAVAKSDYQGAIDYLLPLTKSTNEFIMHNAKIRTASVYLEMKKLDQALAILGDNTNKAFGTLYDYIRGDIYFAKNDFDTAKKHYQLTLSQLPRDSKLANLIQIKLNDLN